MHANPELIADYACVTGEGPLWHAQRRRLYWTDIPSGKLFRLDPATGEHACFYQGRPVGGFTVQADGNLLATDLNSKGLVVSQREIPIVIAQ